MMTNKEKLKKEHLNKIIFNDDIEMMFCDYLNIDLYLYSNININKQTIELINNYFFYDYVNTLKFSHYFRTNLILNLPIYNDMLKNEMRKELFDLSTNINYRRLANANIEKALNIHNREMTNNNDISTENISNSSNTTNTNIDNKKKNAQKDNPMSITANDFNDLFNWDTSSTITEDKENNITNSTNSNNENSKTISNNITKEEEKNKIKNILSSLADTSELSKGINTQAIQSIENINNFLISNNRAIKFLLTQLQKNFININTYN